MPLSYSLRLLLLANCISGAAQGISMITISWYMTKTLGAEKEFGILYAVLTFISLFWGTIAGSLVDRYNRKNIFLITNLTAGTVLLLMALLGYSNGGMTFAYTAIAFATTLFVYNVHYTNLYSFVQEVTDKKNYGNAVAMIEVQGQFTSVIAGTMAALLLYGNDIVIGDFTIPIPKWNLQTMVLIDAITYFVSVGIIAMIPYSMSRNRHIDTGSLKERILGGLGFLQHNKYIFLYGCTSFCVFVTIMICTIFYFPIYINKFLDGDTVTFAISETVYGFGALFAGAFIRRVFGDMEAVKSIIILCIGGIIMFIGLAFIKNIPFFYVMCFFYGIFNAGARVFRATYLFHKVPNEVSGRVGGDRKSTRLNSSHVD